jgi:uroporphyrinogen decarboxylase
VVKIFDSWAGSLKGEDFDRYALSPARIITQELKARHPGMPVIAFPREAGDKYVGFAATDRPIAWRSTTRSRRMGGGARPGGWLRAGQPRLAHMVTGGEALVDETRASSRRFPGRARTSSTSATGSRRMRIRRT